VDARRSTLDDEFALEDVCEHSKRTHDGRTHDVLDDEFALEDVCEHSTRTDPRPPDDVRARSRVARVSSLRPTSNRRTMNALVSSRSVSFKQYVYDVR